jgi:hypothetical protein
MLQKAKTPAGMLAFPGSGVILPKHYCTLGATFCQEKKWEFGGEMAGGKLKPAALKPKAAAHGGYWAPLRLYHKRNTI